MRAHLPAAVPLHELSIQEITKLCSYRLVYCRTHPTPRETTPFRLRAPTCACGNSNDEKQALREAGEVLNFIYDAVGAKPADEFLPTSLEKIESCEGRHRRDENGNGRVSTDDLTLECKR